MSKVLTDEANEFVDKITKLLNFRGRKTTMKKCDKCRVTACLLSYSGKRCEKAQREVCTDVVFTNADRIREMTDKELAGFLAMWGECSFSWMTNTDSVMHFLKYPWVTPQKRYSVR